MLFKVTPALITNWLPVDTTGLLRRDRGRHPRRHLPRSTCFLISLLPDLRRVFQYHAAEHKAINAYEAGEELTPENVQKFSLIHPRCGTAFLLWVMVIGIFVFAFVGQPAWYWLIVSRILLLPVIAGIAYELIRFAGKHQDNAILMALLAPGLWLQRLTTRPAVARPDRGLDPRAPGGAPPRGRHHRRGAQGRGHGLMPRIVRQAAVAWEGSLSRGTGHGDRDVVGHVRAADRPAVADRRQAGEDEPGGAARGGARRLLLDVARRRDRPRAAERSSGSTSPARSRSTRSRGRGT